MQNVNFYIQYISFITRPISISETPGSQIIQCTVYRSEIQLVGLKTTSTVKNLNFTIDWYDIKMIIIKRIIFVQ